MNNESMENLIFDMSLLNDDECKALDLLTSMFHKKMHNKKDLDFNELTKEVVNIDTSNQFFIDTLFLTCFYMENLNQGLELEVKDVSQLADKFFELFQVSLTDNNKEMFRLFKIMDNGRHCNFKDYDYYDNLNKKEKYYYILGYNFNKINSHIHSTNNNFIKIDEMFTKMFQSFLDFDKKNNEFKTLSKKHRTLKF